MREFFTMEEGIIFLNSGTMSKCPDSVLEAKFTIDREQNTNPTKVAYCFPSRFWKTTEKMGEFFGADATDLIFGPNITHILNTFIKGIPADHYQQVLSSNLEYGATLNMARKRAEETHRPIEVLDFLNKSVADICQLLKEKLQPKSLVVLSHIYTGTGQILPLEEVATLCRERESLLVVDGAHGPGVLDLKFNQIKGLQFYAGNLHKWFMGPPGTALGWIAPEYHNILKPLMEGWNSFETVGVFGEYGGEKARFGQLHFPQGTFAYSGLLALDSALDFWKSRGELKIQELMRGNASYLKEKIEADLGWNFQGEKNLENQAPLMTFEMPQKLADEGYSLMARLYKQKNLQISVVYLEEKAFMRFSPQIYNTRAEIDQAVQILRNL